MENDGSILPKVSSVTSSSPNNAQKEEKGGGSSGKRAKSTHACDLCKKKKVKCDGQYPCARCQKSNLSCTFNQHKLKRVSSRLYGNKNDQRLRALEKALDCLQVGSHIQQQYNNTTSQTRTTTQIPIEKFNTSSIGQPYYARDWNGRLDRLPTTFDNMTVLDNEPRKPDAFALPAMTIHHDLLTTYFTHVQPYFPMIHKESFLHQLEDTSPLLLNAMYAVAQQWVSIDSSTNGSAQAPPGLKYYQDTISLVELYTDAPRLSTIQGLLLIIKYNEMVKRPGFFHRTRFYFNLAVRMCKDLGLPRLLPPTCQVHPVLAEQRRRIFWAAYIYDLLMSTELGTPTLFSVDECTVDFPNLMDDERNVREQHDTVLYFHWMTMVMKAQGSVLHYLRSKHSEKNSKSWDTHVHSLHQHMMGLRAELQLWQEPARGRVNFLFLAYHFTNILLYRSISMELVNLDGISMNRLVTLLGMNQDGIKAFLLKEANAIVMIVDQLLKDHTVACLNYSFRGVQQIIHYLTASRTVQCMYQINDNDRIKSIIQQLIPLSPVVEMQSMDVGSSTGLVAGHHQYADGQLQSGIPATTMVHSPISAIESKNNEKRNSMNQQQLQLPSSSSSSSIPSPSPSASPPPPTTTGVPATQHLNDSLLYNSALPSSSSDNHSMQQDTANQSNHIRPPLLLDTSTVSLLYQPSSDPSSITTTPSLGSALSSASSLSTIISTPKDPSAMSSTPAHRSLHLRRSHQQLRNVSTSSLPHRLSYSSDLRSSNSSSSSQNHHHHPYMPSPFSYTLTQSSTANVNTSTLNPALLQQTPRRHTVSSGQSSPSTSSLPSSPLHRMTLSDDPWIQVPPSQHPPPIPPPPSYQQPNLSSSSVHQQDQEEEQVGLHDMCLLEDDTSLSEVPSTVLPLAAESSMMMDILQHPIDSPWDQQHQHYHSQ